MRTKSTSNRPFQEEVLDYLEDRLNDDERYAIEQRWLRDPDTRAAVEGLRNSGLSSMELKNDFAEIRQKHQKRSDRSPAMSTTFWSWAIVVTLLLLTAWSAWGYYQDQQPAQLYADYFAKSTAYEDYLIVRGTTETEVTGLASAITAYGQQDYTNSYTQFQDLREAYPFNSMVLRYTALSAMQVGDFYLAERVLQQNLSIATTSQERAAATWYLALVYLRLEENTAARDLLEGLAAAGPGLYAEQASNLLKELKFR